MNCYIHADREAAGTCVGCGKFICTECTTAVGGKNYCPTCVSSGVPSQNVSSTNTLAIISLVLSLVALPLTFCYGCGILFSIAAIILGFIARKEIKQSSGRQSGDGLALAGLIIGGITTALVILGAVCYLLFLLITVIMAYSSDGYSLWIGLRNLYL
jgi:hypothetical protein